MRPSTELTSRYRLESLIAAGGMGEVWRAVDQALDRPVAVKLLRPEYVHDPVILARFHAEAHYVGQLADPGIAQVYDYADAGPASPAYLVMELVDGPSLAALLATGPLPPRRTADVLAQAAQALHAAHRSGVVHRDIKPGNLLIAAGGRVKMTDFGIASSPRAASLTNTGALLGTIGYLAPERVSGQSATPASDLYALGVVGYECLTGQLPFQGEPLQVALAHRDRPFPALPGWCLGSPAGLALARLIMDMTAKDPALRPGSAVEVAARAAQIRDDVLPAARLGRAPQTRGDAPAGSGPRDVRRPGDPLPEGSVPESPVPAGRVRADRVPGGRLAGAEPGTLTGAGPDRAPHRRGLLAGILALAALVAGVVIWQLAALHTPQPTAAPTASSPALQPAVARTVRVPAALVGQPVSAVQRALRAHGLRVQVQPQPDRQAVPGIVLRVAPTGRLAMGHVVLLTVAVRPSAAASSAPSSQAGPTPSGLAAPGSVPPGRAKHGKGSPPGHSTHG
jgi:eukaryotic-like serine/threonine-protein kinase